MSERRPFGVEYLEEIAVPEGFGLGAGEHEEGGTCCSTFMSTLKPGVDDGEYTCEENIDTCPPMQMEM